MQSNLEDSDFWSVPFYIDLHSRSKLWVWCKNLKDCKFCIWLPSYIFIWRLSGIFQLPTPLPDDALFFPLPSRIINNVSVVEERKRNEHNPGGGKTPPQIQRTHSRWICNFEVKSNLLDFRFLDQIPWFGSGTITRFWKMEQTILVMVTSKADFISQGPRGLIAKSNSEVDVCLFFAVGLMHGRKLEQLYCSSVFIFIFCVIAPLSAADPPNAGRSLKWVVSCWWSYSCQIIHAGLSASLHPCWMKIIFLVQRSSSVPQQDITILGSKQGLVEQVHANSCVRYGNSYMKVFNVALSMDPSSCL